MASVRRAEAHQILADERADVHVWELLALEAIADLIAVAVLSNDKAIAVR